MPALVDARPPGVNVLFLAGNTLEVTFTWPTGSLTGRTFTASLGGVALTVDVVDDAMTVSATAVQTAAVTGTAAFELVETTGGGDDVVISGAWTPSTAPAAVTEAEVTVTESAGSVTVTAQAIPTAVGSLTATGDLTVGGEILTGTFDSEDPNFGATFGGIEREAVCFDVGQILSPTGQIDFGDGVPRLSMPDGVTTDAYIVFEVQEWWLPSSIGVYFEWANDHSTTGDVRWDCSIREYDIGQDTLASGGDLRASRTFTQGSPAANVSTTGVVASIANGNECNFDPEGLAAFYVLRISRLGADGADTLAGPVGLVAASMTRGQ